MNFFKYNKYANVNMSLFERLYPFILIIIIVIIYFYINKNYYLEHYKIKKFILIILYSSFFSYHFLQYSQCGVSLYSLPLELCSLSQILCMITLIYNNISLIFFLESISMPAAFMALISPATGGSFLTLQYQLFILNHVLIFIIPLWYIFGERKVPNIAQVLHSILNFLLIIFSIGVFNFIFDTSYMFISFKKNPINFGIIGAMGQCKIYLLYLGILTIIILMFWGYILQIIRKYFISRNKKIKNY